MKKTTNAKPLVKILTILLLVIGTTAVFQTSAKIVKTSVKMIVLRDNASYYNEQYRKTDAMTQEYLQNNEERQKIYNSEDIVVRIFSNQHILVKIVILLCALALFPLIIYMWIVLIVTEIARFMYRSRKKHNRRKSGKVIPIDRRKSGIA